MYMIGQKRPLSDEVLKEVDKMSFDHRTVALIQGNDNGKSIIWIYDRSENGNKLNSFCCRVNAPYKEAKSDKLPLDNVLEHVTDLESNLQIFNMKNVLFAHKLKAEIVILHRIMGWQQVFDNYIYRGFDHFYLPTKLQIIEETGRVEWLGTAENTPRSKIENAYKEMHNFFECSSEETFLPIFAYMLFSICKSLYSSSNKNFALNIESCLDNDEDERVIGYICSLNNNFNKFNDGMPTNMSQRVLLKYYTKVVGREYNPHIKSSKFKPKDFPIFLYDYSYPNKKISSKTLYEEVIDEVSYIFYDCRESSDCILNVFTGPDLKNLNDQDMEFGFISIISDYLDYIKDILDYDITQKVCDKKERLAREIVDVYNDKIYYSCFDDFINEVFDEIEQKLGKIPMYACEMLEHKIQKLNNNDYKTIIKSFSESKLNDCVCKYTDPIIKEFNFKKKSEKKREKNIDDLMDEYTDMMKSRYLELKLNEYLKIPSVRPKYFDELYILARNELSCKGTIAAKVNQCAFLLASMMSFEDYINDRLPEKSEDFGKYMMTLKKVLDKMCQIKPIEEIDGKAILSEFLNFINEKISENEIIDITSGSDNCIGWYNAENDELWLKNKKNERTFYNDFIQYLINNKMKISYSKPAFVSKILDANGIVQKRTAGKTERYDYEHQINGRKQRVLVLDCNALKKYAESK